MKVRWGRKAPKAPARQEVIVGKAALVQIPVPLLPSEEMKRNKLESRDFNKCIMNNKAKVRKL